MPRDRGQACAKPNRAYQKVKEPQLSRQASLSSESYTTTTLQNYTMLCASESLIIVWLFHGTDTDDKSSQ